MDILEHNLDIIKVISSLILHFELYGAIVVSRDIKMIDLVLCEGVPKFKAVTMLT